MSKVLRDETVFVILYACGIDGGIMIYLQQKDGTYWRKNERFSYSFIGTGMVPEDREDEAFGALIRKLKVEMPNAQRTITDEMRSWKTFSLPRSASVGGEYTCHVYVRMMENQYKMMDLLDAIGSAGKKRATPTYISLERLKQIPEEKFMDSLSVVAKEFLEELETAPTRYHFWESLVKNKQK